MDSVYIIYFFDILIAPMPFMFFKICTNIIQTNNLYYWFDFITFKEAQSNRQCRRLQLKDIIPVEMLRLTKYPLLLENIAKYTGIVEFVYSSLLLSAHVRFWCVDVMEMERSIFLYTGTHCQLLSMNYQFIFVGRQWINWT